MFRLHFLFYVFLWAGMILGNFIYFICKVQDVVCVLPYPQHRDTLFNSSGNKEQKEIHSTVKLTSKSNFSFADETLCDVFLFIFLMGIWKFIIIKRVIERWTKRCY